MTADLTGRVVVVTGASSGFGHHFAGVLARNGATVILGAPRGPVGGASRRDPGLGWFGSCVAARRSRHRQHLRILAGAEELAGPPHSLVNNAGIESSDTYLTTTEDAWDDVIDTNLKSVWMVSKLFTEQVIRNSVGNATIVNISSLTDARALKSQFAYAVSKGGVKRLTEVMALEAARHGIRVNAISPGYFLTALSSQLLESELAAPFAKAIPVRRFGEFRDLDGPLLLLVSDASAYMTGAVIRVDGGHSIQSLTI